MNSEERKEIREILAEVGEERIYCRQRSIANHRIVLLNYLQ